MQDIEKQNTFKEIIVAEPLILRLNWWGEDKKEKGKEDKKEGLFLQSIDMLWREMLGDQDGKGEYRTSTTLSHYGEQIRAGLNRYVAGEAVDWHAACAGIPLLWQGMPPFRKRVLEVLYKKVGHGQTVTYGQLASLAGSPKAARAVGSAMSANPWPLIVP